jgi:O-methyltransferase
MAGTLPNRYLELVKSSVAGLAHERVFGLRTWEFEHGRARWSGRLAHAFVAALARAANQELVVVRPLAVDERKQGGPWPLCAETMIGKVRLDHLQRCIEQVLAEGVAGDLIEAGVWRGGAAILMRAVLEAHEASDRTVWLADSFEGLPEPDPSRFPADRGLRLDRYSELSVSLEQVRQAFDRYGLLDDRVRFLPGWFSDTLPPLRDRTWALVHIDADLYQSTSEALDNLYPSLAPGGFVIVDDYGVLGPCRRAVDDFRARHDIGEELERVDSSAVFWRRR